MQFPHGSTVQLERYVGGGVDSRGNLIDEWAPPVDVPGCALAPTSSAEPFQPGRDVVVTIPALYMPPGTQVAAADRVTVDGDVYTVQGDPLRWDRPHPFTGAQFPVEVRLQRVAG